jgi:hypothetical protein
MDVIENIYCTIVLTNIDKYIIYFSYKPHMFGFSLLCNAWATRVNEEFSIYTFPNRRFTVTHCRSKAMCLFS